MALCSVALVAWAQNDMWVGGAGLQQNNAMAQNAGNGQATGLNPMASAARQNPMAAAAAPRTNADGEAQDKPVLTPSMMAPETMAPRTLTPGALAAAKPNQFQRFVQEATGRLLPVYGYELFESPQAYSNDKSVPAPEDYLLGAGDEVRIQIWGAADYAGTHVVDRSGQISLPKVGVITLAGVPMRNLEAVIKGHVGKVFSNFSLNANLGRVRNIQVFVVGQAQRPGSYTLSGLSTVVNALFASGGPNGNGSMRNIQLKRGNKTLSTLDLYDFIARGDKTGDIALQSGDVILIPPVGQRLAVTGVFDQAAIYEIAAKGSTVGDILNLSGGVPALANTQKALIERLDGPQAAPRNVQEITLNAQGLAKSVKDGDVITLLPISPAFANAVTLQGSVAEPLRHRWFEGMRILDLIPDRDALIVPDYFKRKNQLVQRIPGTREDATENQRTPDEDAVAKSDSNSVINVKRMGNRLRGLGEQINWDYAVIERLDRANLSTELISFNLGKAVIQKDAQHNLQLQAGDVVTIFSQGALRLPQGRRTRLVRVEGEVGAPGLYQARPGETLAQLVERAGGLTRQSYVFGLEFLRENVRISQQESLNRLIKTVENQIASDTQARLQNLKGEDKTAAIQAAIQGDQARLNNLRNLRANGRIVLNMDPLNPRLPNLPLEDGDTIYVPQIPSFVGAFGAVLNENAVLWREGLTVDEVLAQAGLSTYAEESDLHVLHADGRIEGGRKRSSMFGFLAGGSSDIRLMPGDTLIVPEKADRETGYSAFIRGAKDWTAILSQFGLGAVAIKTLRN